MNEPTTRIATAARLRLLAASIVVLGITLAAGIYYQFSHTEYRMAKERFLLISADVHEELEKQIQLYMDVLHSLRALHSLSSNIDPQTLNEFVQKGMGYQKEVVGSFGFVQRIPHEARQSFETIGRGGAGLPIITAGPSGTFRPAPVSSEYAPLTFQIPAGGLSVPRGFDFHSRPADHKANLQMALTGKAAMGGSVFGTNASPYARYIFDPIFYLNEHPFLVPEPRAFIGFVVGVFSPAPLLNAIRNQFLQTDISMELLPDMESEAITDQHSMPEAGRTYPNQQPSPLPFFTAPVPVADARWTLTCTPSPDYFKDRSTHEPQLAATVVGSIAILLATLLYILSRRTQLIEETVKRRTDELERTNLRLADEMDERKRLQKEILETAAKEQYRVGRDLHDSLGQQLAGGVYLAKLLVRNLEKTGHAAAQGATEVHQLLKEAVSQVRRIAKGLAPVNLDEEGLPAALERLADTTRRIYNVECEIAIEGTPTLPNAQDAGHLFQIAQEAVTNAMRHGQATRIRIHLTEHALTVQDNGHGFEQVAETAAGMGLRIMKHRATLLGAEIFWNSDSNGTQIQCTILPHSENGNHTER